MKKVLLSLLFGFLLAGCGAEKPVNIKPLETSSSESSHTEAVQSKVSLINEKGDTIEQRFKTPEGFQRVTVAKESFQEFLRTQKLKPHGSKVLYYNGDIKDRDNVYEAVLSVDIGKRDLHQCADAVMLLRAEYLYKNEEYNKIHFNFTNGFRAEYNKWSKGYRIQVSGNKVLWVKSKGEDKSYLQFRKYMEMVFSYAGTLSLEKELKEVDINEMQIGDVFIKGGSPGHAVIVVDMAENKKTNKKLFMLAQSYMPAQETQVLCNPSDDELSPWYSLDFEEQLNTPEWTFSKKLLKRFIE